ncbi:MAG: xylulokinase [Boseongicola sp. SB0676_bin_33]|nr:xylulokinase [Boseongicola sp. SB0676_bin_33]
MKAAGHWLGIDLGTSGVKMLLMNAVQEAVALRQAKLDVSRPRPGRSEQDPRWWWEAVKSALDELAGAHGEEMAQVRGIGLSGQMHGATLLDANDRVLRPCILWNDGRSEAECAALDARADFAGIGGNLVMPGFTAPKIEWVRTHEPDIFERVAKVLLPKDWLRLCLAGEHLSDMSDSAGTLWMDVGGRCWSSELLDATGLSEDHMPGLVEGSEQAGRLRPELADRWGMAAPPVIAGGGGDNAASAAGVGAVAPGTGFVSLGPSGVRFAATDGFAPNVDAAVHAFCHAVPGTWHQMGVILSATDTLNWLGRVAGRDPAALVAGIDPARPAGEPLTFLPYLSGERTPHNDAGARGVLAGMSQATDIGDLVRAAMEGVAYAFADCVEALRSAGTDPDLVHAIGGGARSRSWVQMIADASGLPLSIPVVSDSGAAFGAARLGMAASEGGDPQEVCAPVSVVGTIDPDPGMAGYHAENLARYRALYAGVRSVMTGPAVPQRSN